MNTLAFAGASVGFAFVCYLFSDLMVQTTLINAQIQNQADTLVGITMLDASRLLSGGVAILFAVFAIISAFGK